MKIFSLLLCLVHFFLFRCIAGDAVDKVAYREYDDYLLTHSLIPVGPVPTAFDANGVYPYVSYAETSNRPVLKKYRFIVLEKDQLSVTTRRPSHP